MVNKMPEKYRKIYIVTPLRDEISNIDSLISSISSSSYPVEAWVVVENNSTDGSKEKLESIRRVGSVASFVVLNRDEFSKSYQLGGKYSAIVNEGFEYLKNSFPIGDEDLIGIVDADSFPTEDYYSSLVQAFDKDDSLGITSGRAKIIGGDQFSVHAKSWVMGSCRLWRYKCFLESGYVIGPSADTVSVALANIKGWKSYPVSDTYFYAREVGKRVSFSYYGQSAYFRGNTPAYAFIRSIKYFLKGNFTNSFMFLKGYFSDYFAGRPRVNNLEVREYFSEYLIRAVKQWVLR